MRHPTRAITRDLRTRRAKRPGRGDDEVSTLGWPETTLRVRDVMNRQPVIARCGITVGDAWRLMRARKIRHVPVLDDKRRLVGIVTDRDLRQAVLEPWAEERVGDAANVLSGTPVERVMTWGVVTVAPDAEIRQAAHIMREQRIGALPVVRAGRVVGMLTATDLVRAVIDLLSEGVLSKPERWRAEG